MGIYYSITTGLEKLIHCVYNNSHSFSLITNPDCSNKETAFTLTSVHFSNSASLSATILISNHNPAHRP